MGQGPRYRVAFRRRREGRTDYRHRLGLVKGGKPRLVVRRTLRNVIVQVVEYGDAGDVIRAQAQSRELKEQGWTGYTENTPAAYLTGLLAARRAREAGIEDAVLDLGRQVPTPGGNIFAALAGAIDGGLNVPHGGDILPPGQRLRGDHLGKPEMVQAFEATRSKIAPDAKPLKLAEKKKEKKGAPPPAAPTKGGKPAKGGAGGAPKGDKPAKAPKAEKPREG